MSAALPPDDRGATGESSANGLGQRLQRRFPALGRLGLAGPRQVPVIQQLTETECGAACLAMVLGYHGKSAGLEAVRQVCAAGRDGVNAADILAAASHFGLSGRGVKADLPDLSLLPPGSTILHWELRHFVVLAAVGKHHVEIVDPAVGRRRLPLSEVGRAWSGVALAFEPGGLFQRQPPAASGVYPAIKQLLVGSGLLRRILLMSVLLQLFGLGLPLLTGQVIDSVLPRGDLSLLTVMLAGLGLMVVFRSLSQLVRGHLLLHLGTLLDARLTLGFLDHLVSLPLSFFGRRSAGDLLMRLSSTALVREKLTSGALSGVLDGLMVIVYVGVLLLGNLAMAGTAIAAGLLDVAGFLLVRRRQRELAAEELHLEARAQGYEVELVTAIETLKSTGCEQRAVGHWSNLFVDQLNAKLRRERLAMVTDSVLAGLRLAGPLAILAVGAGQVLAGALSLGAMLALAAVATAFLQPLGDLVQTLLSFEQLRGSLDRMDDVLAATPEQAVLADGETRASARLAPRLSGRIRLERVSFRYQPGGPLVLSDVSLDIAPGQFVAIVGRSGSGKTTLANVILGLHPPESGRVLFDGLDLRAVDLRSVRQQLGVVNQSFGLFGLSIRENLTLIDPSLPLAAVERAARLACVHDDILDLPLGYETPLGDRGTSLSGGQRQRLALARALVRQPAVLLLDEATSALDAETEHQVQASLAGLACTRIVIAHRLSTVKRADVILVVEAGAGGGTIVESGSHASLLAAGGAYARLVAAQLEEDPEADVAAPIRAAP